MPITTREAERAINRLARAIVLLTRRMTAVEVEAARRGARLDVLECGLRMLAESEGPNEFRLGLARLRASRSETPTEFERGPIPAMEHDRVSPSDSSSDRVP